MSAVATTLSNPAPPIVSEVSGDSALAGDQRTPRGTDAIVALLRDLGSPRPLVDPGLGPGLREWLEDVVGPYTPGRLGTKSRFIGPSTALGRYTASSRPGHLTMSECLSVMVDALFRVYVLRGSFDDPLCDALDVLGLEPRQRRVLDFVNAMHPKLRERLESTLSAHAAVIVDRLARIHGAWLPRAKDRILVPLAGGHFVLGATVDLMLGTPSSGTASVCLVALNAGEHHQANRELLAHYALLETIRSGAAPFRVAMLTTADDRFEFMDVDETLLLDATQRVIAHLPSWAATAP